MADVATPADTTPTAPAAETAAAPSSSSPASDAPASPSAAGETAPATDARSVWREMEAAASGSPPETPPDPSLAEAARQPDGDAEAPGSLPTRGPIPYDRHQAVLTTARKKEREETERQLRDQYAWSQRFERYKEQAEDVEYGVNLFSLLKRDPEGLVRLIQSQINGTAGTNGAAAAKAPADPEPEPDIPLEDGRTVYSADQMRKWGAWNQRQIQQQIDATYGPIRDRIALQDLQQKSWQEAGLTLKDCRTNWPMFADLEKDIKAAMLKDQRLSLHDAYIATMRDVGLKRQREQWDAERSGQLTRKAAASTVQPGMPRPSTPRPDAELSSRDIVRQEWRRHAAG